MIFEMLSLAIALVALIVSIVSLIYSNKNSLTDRKADTYVDAIVYLDKITFRSQSPEFGFGDSLISEVNDDWVKEQIMDAVDIYSRIKLFDENKAKQFLNLVSLIYGEEHIFDQEKYQALRNEIMVEIK